MFSGNASNIPRLLFGFLDLCPPAVKWRNMKARDENGLCLEDFGVVPVWLGFIEKA